MGAEPIFRADETCGWLPPLNAAKLATWPNHGRGELSDMPLDPQWLGIDSDLRSRDHHASRTIGFFRQSFALRTRKVTGGPCNFRGGFGERTKV